MKTPFASSLLLFPSSLTPLRVRAAAAAVAFALSGAVYAQTPSATLSARATSPASANAPGTSPAAADSVAPLSSLSSAPVPDVPAKAWLTMDVASGQILAAVNPQQRIEPASLTKLMTSYLVFEALKEKRITLDQTVTVSTHAWHTGGSRMFIEPRVPVTIGDLVQGMVVQSGNDASVALAEAVAGTESTFAAMMNSEAQRLGMTQTHFVNATGLPDPQHYTTVEDLALVSAALIRDFPEYYHYYGQKAFTYNKITQPNRNRLLWADPSVDGLKTGHTDAAGYCLVGSALRGQRRVLTVVVGADSDSARTEASLKLLNWSFQNFDTATLFANPQSALDVPVWDGKNPTVKAAPAKPLEVSVPAGKASQVQTVLVPNDTPVAAPVAQGQQVGMVRVSFGGTLLAQAPLLAQEAMPRAGFVQRMFDKIKRMIHH